MPTQWVDPSSNGNWKEKKRDIFILTQRLWGVVLNYGMVRLLVHQKNIVIYDWKGSQKEIWPLKQGMTKSSFFVEDLQSKSENKI